MGLVRIMSWYPKFNGSHAFWHVTQLYPQHDWTGWQNVANDDVCTGTIIQTGLNCMAMRAELFNPSLSLFYCFTCTIIDGQ